MQDMSELSHNILRRFKRQGPGFISSILTGSGDISGGSTSPSDISGGSISGGSPGGLTSPGGNSGVSKNSGGLTGSGGISGGSTSPSDVSGRSKISSGSRVSISPGGISGGTKSSAVVSSVTGSSAGVTGELTASSGVSRKLTSPSGASSESKSAAGITGESISGGISGESTVSGVISSGSTGSGDSSGGLTGSQSTPEEGAPDPPTGLEISNTDGPEINLQWTSSQKKDQPAIDYYILEGKVDGKWKKIKSIDSEESKLKVPENEIKGASEFRMIAANAKGRSNPSDPVPYHSGSRSTTESGTLSTPHEGAPDPPTELKIRKKGSALHLEWNASEKKDRPSIDTYILEGNVDGQWKKIKAFDSKESIGKVQVDKVKNATKFRMVAANSKGRSNPSDPVSYQSGEGEMGSTSSGSYTSGPAAEHKCPAPSYPDEYGSYTPEATPRMRMGRPSRPTSLHLILRDKSLVCLAWLPPRYSCGRVDCYIVQIQVDGQWQEVITTMSSRNSVMIYGLPDKYCKVRLRAVSEGLVGRSSRVLDICRAGDTGVSEDQGNAAQKETEKEAIKAIIDMDKERVKEATQSENVGKPKGNKVKAGQGGYYRYPKKLSGESD